MKRFASVAFEAALASSERDVLTRALDSAERTVTSWNAAGPRTFATLVFTGARALAGIGATILEHVACDARVAYPPEVVLRIAPDAARLLPTLERALGGAGRPAGMRDVVRTADALVVAFDPRSTSLATLVTFVDRELASAPGRTIEPLVPLDDTTLVAFAASRLREPDLGPERLIEPHLAAAIASARA